MCLPLSRAGFGGDTITAHRDRTEHHDQRDDPGQRLQRRKIGQPGWIVCRFMIAFTHPGATVSSALAVTAIRGAMRTGRVRAAITIQSAASAAVSAGSPS